MAHLRLLTTLAIIAGLTSSSTLFAQCEIHETAKLTASDAAPFDRFGLSVSVSGDTAVVGAYSDNCGAGLECGSAYVYRFIGSNWFQEVKLTASDAAASDYFGVSVSVSGDVTVVGAMLDDAAAGNDQGSAYVYRRSGTSWVQEQKLTASDAAGHHYFGISVSVSGDIAVVGSLFDGCGAGVECGSAYVYRFDGSVWIEVGKLTAADAAANDQFGWSVSVSGNTVVVGAHYDDCGAGGDCGSAYVYQFNGSNWVQQSKLTASDPNAGARFGKSVSVSGDTAIVGAFLHDCGGGPECGSAYVYRFNPGAPGYWIEEQKLTASDAGQYDQFGVSVSVSGNVAVVGAVGDHCASGGACGSAYVYRFNPGAPGHWVEEEKLTASDAGANHAFAASLSVSGDVIVVGAHGHECALGNQCGSGYVFTLADCNANGIADECDITACAGDPPCGDCNANLAPDGCDIASGTAADCNANGIPDECDIANCPGDPACADCNANSIPDGCEADCNSNAIPDECDIRAGVSRDADANGVPDECEAGACCDRNTGLCADDVPMGLCSGNRRSWSVNTLCAELDPACLAPVGACCDRDSFGDCTDGLTRAECSCPRCEWTEDALCDDVACPRDSIPTVSSWGLAILSLLLMTGAKVRFGRIRRT